ncbi:MAG: adenylate/guanylate cyclase domain-containing protein [Candidatus Coatesbacteria bacterium]|nr:adenylate/guanylate cyclase domain-containing protein [Candidatus Coatesbacteria bacterium]
MRDLPQAVTDYIFGLTIEATRKRSPAYLLGDGEGRLIEFGGKLALYGINNPELGVHIDQQVEYLAGFLPLEGEPVVLPCLKCGDGVSTDLHIFSGEGGDWILFLESTEIEATQQEIQQHAHELSLNKEKQSRMLSQFLGDQVAQGLEDGKFDIKKGGERRNLTILFADIRDFTPFSENHSPQAVFRTLNIYIRSMMETLAGEASSLNAIVGDQVMAVFGIFSAAASHQFRAVGASLKMIEKVNELYEERKRWNLPALRIGIGVSSGPVAIGILGTKERKTLTVIGHYVNLAARLQSLASPGEILIDKNTYDNIRSYRRFFSPTTLECKGIVSPVKTFSNMGKN